MTPEGRIKEKIKAALREVSAYAFMPVQSGYGRPTLDFLGCHAGRFFAVEAKALGKKPTKFQLQTIAQMQAAGAIVFIVDSEETLEALRVWLSIVT